MQHTDTQLQRLARVSTSPVSTVTTVKCVQGPNFIVKQHVTATITHATNFNNQVM